MSNEEGEAICVEYSFADENPSDVELLDQRELIQLVKNNPPLFAKTTKEYCGKRYNKDLAWQRVGSSLSKPLSGPDASKLFYNIRQRFGRERRKVLSSLKGKSGQGAMAQYVFSWPLYEDCMFLADHIVARKRSSSYSSALPLPNTKQAAAIKSASLNFETRPFQQLSRMFARPSLSLSPSPSPSPPVFRATPSSQKISEVPSPNSVWSSDSELFLGDVDTDSQGSAGQSPVTIAGTAELQQTSSSSGVSSASIQKIKKETGSKRKRTVPLPDNFAIKKKKDEDVLTQAILSQTTALSSMAAKLCDSFSNSNNPSNSSVADSNNSININPIMGAISFALQSVPLERHLECMMELLRIITEKFVKK